MIQRTALPLSHSGEVTGIAHYAHNGTYSYFGIEPNIPEIMRKEDPEIYLSVEAAIQLRDALDAWIAATKESES